MLLLKRLGGTLDSHLPPEPSLCLLLLFLLAVLPVLCVLASVSIFFSTKPPERTPVLNPAEPNIWAAFRKVDTRAVLEQPFWNQSNQRDFHGYGRSMNLLFQRYTQQAEQEKDSRDGGKKGKRSKGNHKHDKRKFASFQEAVKGRSRQRKILLKMVAEGEYGMALNFYEASLTNVNNYLFVTLDRNVSRILQDLGIACYTYKYHDYFDHSDFIYKFQLEERMAKFRTEEAEVYMKVKAIYDVLRWGFTILFVDSNVMYFKNPWPCIRSACPAPCQLAVTSELEEGEKTPIWGVNFARPKRGAVNFYSGILYLLLQLHIVDRQNLRQNFMLREGFENFTGNIRGKDIRYLSPERYFPASSYFTNRKRVKQIEQGHCMAVYEDMRARPQAELIYAMKEMRMWKVDLNHYYSNASQKFIIYRNPITYNHSMITMFRELQALRNALALGVLLKRIVILPRFHCPPHPRIHVRSGSSCTLRDLLHMSPFDKEFHRWYRESTFLSNTLTPAALKKLKHNTRDVFFLGAESPPYLQKKSVVRIQSRSPQGTLSDKDLLLSLGSYTQPLLVFASLYGRPLKFQRMEDTVMFNKLINRAFRVKTYIKKQLEHRNGTSPLTGVRRHT